MSSSILSSLTGTFDRLSERERRLVLALAAAFFVLAIGGSIWWASARLEAKQRRVKDMRATLEQMASLEAQYKAAEQAERQAEMRLRTNNVSIFSLLQKAAQELNLTLNDLNERKTPVKDTERISEISVDVNLKEVSIDRLHSFLEKIEGQSSSGLVKIMKLKVKTRYDNPEMLDVSMTVATWKAGA
jgi:multidrug efflux pump subunit AcrB